MKPIIHSSCEGISEKLLEAFVNQAKRRRHGMTWIVRTKDKDYYLMRGIGNDDRVSISLEPLPKMPGIEFGRRVKPETRTPNFNWAHKLWKEIHEAPFSLSKENLLVFFDSIYSKLPCGECKAHWLKLKSKLPPIVDSPESAFTRTWEWHEEINAFKSKPSISRDEARKLYGINYAQTHL